MKRYDFHVKQFMIEEAIEFLGLKERFTIENRMNRQHKIILALFLSALSGFIDILGLFGIGKMFLSFMSGNSTRLAFYLAAGDDQVIKKFDKNLVELKKQLVHSAQIFDIVVTENSVYTFARIR